ncbi:MAG: PKD domain-containing protein [Mariniphaga sp.]|nr:PKD domain-containing protein [Mariniphaga sp.]
MKQELIVLKILLPSLFILIGHTLHAQTDLRAKQKRNIISLVAKETITPIEINHGDAVHYTNKAGEKLTIELLSTSANVIYTNKYKIPPDESGNDRGNMFRARLLYEFTCDLKINGLPMTMRRYVGSQESFYEPYVMNGVRIWFDGVSAINEENGGFLNTARTENGIPKKHARFVFHDMTQRICPGEIHPWFIDGEEKDESFIYRDNFIDIGRCYNGDDCFLGAYLGGEAHGALDVVMEKNTLMYAPFDMDTQEGIRAAGSKKWSDGSVWRINTGHVIEKFVPDNVPLKAGTVYGRGAKRAVGFHPHAHFGFAIFENEILYDIDTWIIFWQLFEDNKKRDGVLRAMMNPLHHSKTGELIQFQGKRDQEKRHPSKMEYFWTFGDGGSSVGPAPEHVYTKAGIYPVTLTIDNGVELASFTQHITIEGSDATQPSIALSCPDEPAFRKRPLDAMDVYSRPVKFVPHSLEFWARPSRPKPNTKEIQIQNGGDDALSNVTFGVDYKNHEHSWLKIQHTGNLNNQTLEIGVDGQGLPAGQYEAVVSVFSEGALNSPQDFRVVLNVPDYPAKTKGITVDDKDEAFYCTPYFWVGHRYHGWGWPLLKDAEGYNHFYLINGERAKEGEFVRFNPDLQEGIYDLYLYEKTPFASGPPADNEPARFQARVVSAEGDTTFWMEPERTKGLYPRPHEGPDGWYYFEPQPSRSLGTFKFEEGKDGFVEIMAGGSKGQVIADAIHFLRKDDF